MYDINTSLVLILFIAQALSIFGLVFTTKMRFIMKPLAVVGVIPTLNHVYDAEASLNGSTQELTQGT